jgi:hypothetical protein
LKEGKKGGRRKEGRKEGREGKGRREEWMEGKGMERRE